MYPVASNQAQTPHIFRLDYKEGNYTVYVDNKAVGTAESDIRASAIGMGHPPCYYLPFSHPRR